MMPSAARHELPVPERRAGRAVSWLCLAAGVIKTAAGLLLWSVPVELWLPGVEPRPLIDRAALASYLLCTGIFVAWLSRIDRLLVAPEASLSPGRPNRQLAATIAVHLVVALVTLLGFSSGQARWPLAAVAGGEALVALVLWLLLIRGLARDLGALNGRVILPGLDRPRPGRALLVYFSLSGNGGKAVKHVRQGLIDSGYDCFECAIRPVDRDRFEFPFRSLGTLMGILAGALFRRPVRVERELFRFGDAPGEGLDAGELPDCDLVVCVSQTWMLGISGPIQGFFDDPDGRRLLAGRDVAIVNVCRGLWRRSQAQLARLSEGAGGRVVAASAHANPGREPMRLFSLFAFLVMGPTRYPAEPRGIWAWLTPQFLDAGQLAELRSFGARLAHRPTHDQALQVGDPARDSEPADALALDASGNVAKEALS